MIALRDRLANRLIGAIKIVTVYFTQVDITEGVPKQSTIYFCRDCERYLQPPSIWIVCSLESRELLTLCLKRLKGLSKLHLVDASFIWTEPHSKRLKMKLTVQKEVLGSTLLQQVFVVEFIVHNQICEDCQRRDAKDYWRAVVQVRQKMSHKKTFLYLEQLILKHNAHMNVIRIKEIKGGLDFYYGQKQDARKLVEFISSVVPSRYKTSQELISHDTHCNTFNYKYTFSIEIVPICKDNIACLPRKLAQSLGNISPIVFCNKVTNSLQVLDPCSLQMADISSNVYWRSPFQSLFDHRQYIQFLVLTCEIITGESMSSTVGNKYVLAEAWVAPLEEIDRQIYCRTHLGHFLNPGDIVWGFDFTRSNINNEHIEKLKPTEIPDVVLIKKSYGDRYRRHKKRKWQLKSLPKDVEAMEEDADNHDLMDFMEDLEEDKTFRKEIDIYMKPKTVKNEDDIKDEEYPQIEIEEMLQCLSISDQTQQ